MRRKRSLIAILVIFALLAGTYIYLANRPPETPEQVDKKPVIDISKVDRDKIVMLSLQNENLDEELIFEMETRTVESKDKDEEPKTESGWVRNKPYSIQLNQSKVTDLARSFASLTAEIIVEENPQDLSPYGLDKPTATGIATLDDGTKITLKLGNKAADGTTWYLMKEGDPKVYTVWNQHGDRLNSTLTSFRDNSLPTVDPTKMTYFHLSGTEKREIEIVTNDNLNDELAAYGLNLFYLVKPFQRPRGVDSTKLGERLEKMPAFTIKEFVEDHPTDYSKYGLDEPKIRFVMKDQDENTLDLSFGNSLEDGTIYFKTQDSEGVYLMDESQLDFLNFGPMDIADKFALLMNIEDVNKVTVEGRGRKNILSITRKTVKAEEEGKEDKVEATYFLDGKEVKEKAFKAFYQSMIGVVVDTEKNHTAQGTPDLKITYHQIEGGDAVVELYPYDKDFYSLVSDGDMESEFLIYRNRVDWVFNDLDKLIAGDLGEE